MKYVVRVAAVLAVACIIIFVFSYNYRQEQTHSNYELTTADMESKNTTTKAKRQLVAENEEGDYQLYLDGNTVILVRGDTEKELKNWAPAVRQEAPQMFFNDYDGDGEGELLIKLVNSIVSDNGASRYVYNLYLFKPVEEDGKKDFSVISADSDTWKVPFEQAIKAEMSQLKSCEKIMQFVMDNADASLTYDKETGLSTNNHVAFAAALKSNDGTYEKFTRWSRGTGFYNVDEDGNITLEIGVFAYYEGISEGQDIGCIKTQIGVVNGRFDIIPDTIVFEANEQYKVTSPLDATDESWTSTINNSYSQTAREDDDMVIDWIEASFDLGYDYTEQTVSYYGTSSQIKCIESVTITPTSIALTAQEGYTFSDSILNTFNYYVKINYDDGLQYNIEYDGEIKTEGERQTLVISFDRAYSRAELDKMEFSYGI